MKEHPVVSLGAAKQIPRAMDDPIMIFDSATQPERLVVMFGLKGENGQTVMVLVELDVHKDRTFVNLVTSVYGNKPAWFLDQITNGKLRYQDKKQKPRVGEPTQAAIAPGCSKQRLWS
ncbi:MAG: hypothetical protein RBR18_11080 [Desulfovibrionaceae bacterium]|nr:hypothetical protein [Desulfovibrionaceae bacterium]